eukprot:1806777-Alexandrium_andersonii.AAC.1
MCHMFPAMREYFAVAWQYAEQHGFPGFWRQQAQAQGGGQAQGLKEGDMLGPVTLLLKSVAEYGADISHEW